MLEFLRSDQLFGRIYVETTFIGTKCINNEYVDYICFYVIVNAGINDFSTQM